ncbi:MAG: twin-arginine translocase subunit TatC [Deltaproteobacteria bacterium]|nr:twin-arginine translocase subunit TatC [Deltaproteobacteria bacterium]
MMEQDTNQPIPPANGTLAFGDHLRELVARLRLSVVAVIVASIVAYIFSQQLFDLLVRPLMKAFPAGESLHFASPVEPFFAYLTVAVIGGVILSAPFLLYQVWAFVAPGLYPKERRIAMPFMIFTVLFFFGGVLFGYFVVLPVGFKFLIGYARNNPANFSLIHQVASWLSQWSSMTVSIDQTKLSIPVAALEPTIMMKDYLGLASKLLLAFGLIFELPLFIYFLARIGLVTHRHLIKFFRYFIVIAFFVAAILTPPDVATQVLMAVPLVVMYLASTVVAYVVTRNREKRQPEVAMSLDHETSSDLDREAFGDPLDDLETDLPTEPWNDDDSSAS